VIEPLIVEFTVNTTVDHAFETWTRNVASWWPRDHTKSRDTDLSVIYEPFVGGRIYERTTSGIEHDWGQITAWSPPHRVAYDWHIYGEKHQAPAVEVTFQPASTKTVVRIKHTGLDRLGNSGAATRAGNFAGWSEVIEPFVRSHDTSVDATNALSAHRRSGRTHQDLGPARG
jgi:uncharacterized protein YndB with AHSA1/START domain